MAAPCREPCFALPVSNRSAPGILSDPPWTIRANKDSGSQIVFSKPPIQEEPVPLSSSCARVASCPSIVSAHVALATFTSWVPPATSVQRVPRKTPVALADKSQHVDPGSIPRLRELVRKVQQTAISIQQDAARVEEASLPRLKASTLPMAEARTMNCCSPGCSSNGLAAPMVVAAGDDAFSHDIARTKQQTAVAMQNSISSESLHSTSSPACTLSAYGRPEPLWHENSRRSDSSEEPRSDEASSQSSAPSGPDCLPKRFLVAPELRAPTSSHGVGSDLGAASVLAMSGGPQLLALIDELMSICDIASSGENMEAMRSRARTALMRTPLARLLPRKILDPLFGKGSAPHAQPSDVMAIVDALMTVYEIRMQEGPLESRPEVINRECDVSEASADEQVFCKPHVSLTACSRSAAGTTAASLQGQIKAVSRSGCASVASIVVRIEEMERQLDFERWGKVELTARFERLLRDRAEEHARDISALECALSRARGRRRKSAGSTGSEPTATPSDDSSLGSRSSIQIHNERPTSPESSILPTVSDARARALQSNWSPALCT